MLLWDNLMQRPNSGSDSPRSKTHQSDRSSSVASSDNEHCPGVGDSIVSRVRVAVLCRRRHTARSKF
jgi:hypothetical protein